MPYFDRNATSLYFREAGKGKTALIFIHGWYQTGSEAWARLSSELSPRYRLFALDLPGHGLSDQVPRNFSLTTNAQLIESFVAFVRKAYKIQKVILVGHSYGAFATLDVLSKQNADIDAAIAISAIDDYAPYVRRLRQVLAVPRLLDSLYYRLQGLLGLFPYGDRLHLYATMPEPLVPSRMAYARIKNHTLSIANSRAYMSSFLTGKVVWPTTPLKVPLLLAYGERDALTPSRHALAIRSHFVKSEVVVLSKSGHNVQISAAPELAQKIASFIEKSLRHAFTGKDGSHVRRPH